MEVVGMKSLLVALASVAFLGLVAMAQTTSDVFSVLQGNSAVPRTLVERLSLFFEAALKEGTITPQQALELLGAVGWQELSPESDVGFATHALELALVALSSGGLPYKEVLATVEKAFFQEGAIGPLAATKVTPTLPALAQALVRAKTENVEQIMARVAERLRNRVPLATLSKVLHRLWAAHAPAEEILSTVERLPPRPLGGAVGTPAGGPPAHIPAGGFSDEEEERPGKGRGRKP